MQTTPSLRPQKALIAADEFIYVIGATFCSKHADLAKLVPSVLDLFDRRHIGHRASRTQIGQDHTLRRLAQNVRRLGHKMDAAKDDELSIGLRRHHRKLIRVARQVGVPDHVVTLVMVSENDDALPELASRYSIRSATSSSVMTR